MWSFSCLAFGRIVKLILLCLRRRESSEAEGLTRDFAHVSEWAR